ncbi:2-hydroxyacid dehydrogenase [Paracoccus sp. MBLB3053]|uniref:2-hydroxyacid dehydrogenase n=1 Tax=Paracoccus aurantius TaxID=3073814 RepID=A0ABU2HXY0_9RHOB|nr:2-hydroxyacid dehydrogenase [Paracoccus sp. MBLB3053]MDS9469400.1 2-hydroxyacid dehydrogenase [Paracoccus sp. MBLB3053]
MRVTVFSTKPYDKAALNRANAASDCQLRFHSSRLSQDTLALADKADAVCVFVNDQLDAKVIAGLAERGVRLIALRCAGFNNVDLVEAGRRGIAVARVPAYSPHAVAEHTMALILALNRKITRAWNRVREGNFELDGLIGFDLHGKTAGIVGTGAIGVVLARILTGFGCRVLAHDLFDNPDCLELGVTYVPVAELLAQSHILSLHCPLTPGTRHLINADTIASMRQGAMLINTSRGALIDTAAAIEGLKSGRIGALGIDVYEEEGDLFFEDLSSQIIPDDVFARLLTFPNVLITGHQAFLTTEALDAIAQMTLANISAFSRSGAPLHPVTAGA